MAFSFGIRVLQCWQIATKAGSSRLMSTPARPAERSSHVAPQRQMRGKWSPLTVAHPGQTWTRISDVLRQLVQRV